MKKTKLYKDNKLIGEFMGFKMDMEDYPYKMKIPHFFVNADGSWTPNPMVCSRDYSEWADGYRGSDSGVDRGIGGYNLDINSLEFNTHWDSLMLVVDKIETITTDEFYTEFIFLNGTNVGLRARGLHDGSVLFESMGMFKKATTKIEATYLIILDFIKWYNKILTKL